MRTLLIPLAALALVACTTTPEAPPPAIAEAAAPAPPAPMSPAALAAHIETLSADAMEGRAPATPGERMALDYMTAQLEAAGFKPGPGGWLQPAALTAAEVTNAPALRVRGKDGEKAYAYREDQVSWSKRAGAQAELKNSELVFVGYGVVAPELGWNDYAGVNMRGKTAVILINDPDFETPEGHATTGKFGGKAMTYYGRWTYKLEEAARQGAAGALIIHETAPAAYPFAVVQTSWTGVQFDTVQADGGASRPAVEGWITEAAAQDLFKRAGLSFADLKTRAQTGKAKPKPMGLKASMTIEQTFAETVSNNLIAMLPGTERPEEVVLYTAHHDHLGRCPPVNGDDICNGAADNAAGVSMMLEIARAHAAAGPAKRTIAVIGFAAEEKGLLGSAYYAANPVFPIAKTVGGVNMDGASIYGPARDITVVGFGKSDLDARLAAAAERQGRRLSPEAFPERGSFYRSDHFNLAKRGVPMLFTSAGLDLIEGGTERGKALSDQYVAERYHKPDDEYDPAWNLEGAAQDAQLLYEVGRGLAEGTDWPNWAPGSEFAAARAAAREAP